MNIKANTRDKSSCEHYHVSCYWQIHIDLVKTICCCKLQYLQGQPITPSNLSKGIRISFSIIDTYIKLLLHVQNAFILLKASFKYNTGMCDITMLQI